MKTVEIEGTALTAERYEHLIYTKESLESAKASAPGTPIIDSDGNVLGKVKSAKVETDCGAPRLNLTADLNLSAERSALILKHENEFNFSIGFIIKRKTESLIAGEPSVVEEIDVRQVGIELGKPLNRNWMHIVSKNFVKILCIAFMLVTFSAAPGMACKDNSSADNGQGQSKGQASESQGRADEGSQKDGKDSSKGKESNARSEGRSRGGDSDNLLYRRLPCDFMIEPDCWD